MGVIAPRKGKTSSAFLASNPTSWQTSFSRKENERFWPEFFSWVGAGDRSVSQCAWCAACTHRTQQHCAFARTPTVPTNTASMDLGWNWFGCLKQFSRSITIVFACDAIIPFFLQEFGSRSAKDCLKFDCSSLWPPSVEIPLEGVCILHIACHIACMKDG